MLAQKPLTASVTCLSLSKLAFPHLAAHRRLLHHTPLLRLPVDVNSVLDAAKPAPPTGKTVELDYELHPAASDSSTPAGSAKAVVIAHGLFGSKQNWRSLSKLMAQRWALPVYAVDLRNHGTSPHAEGMNYVDMASDLLRFVEGHSLKNVALIGHSMGGKAVQSFALSPELPEGALDSLIIVDMSPAKGKLSPEFEEYARAMIRINEQQCQSRKEAEKLLAMTEPVSRPLEQSSTPAWQLIRSPSFRLICLQDLGIRQFLLTNLHRAEPGSPWMFRIPVETISRHISQIGNFPYELSQRQWKGRTLFVKGEKSKYINRRNIPICDVS